MQVHNTSAGIRRGFSFLLKDTAAGPTVLSYGSNKGSLVAEFPVDKTNSTADASLPRTAKSAGKF